MAYIKFNNVSIDIPVFNANSRSLKNKIIRIVSIGKLGNDTSGHIIVKALKNLNFELKKGDKLGIIGSNGAGKSTLLRAISGVYPPTKGKAIIQGNVSSLIDISLGIDPEATGRENIFLRGALLGIMKERMKEIIDEIIEFSDLNEFIDMPVRTYSTGMHLRLAFSVSTVIKPEVAIARALFFEREVLIMDEWLSVGDENFKNKADTRLANLVNSTDVLVIASHSSELIKKNCNRVIWLENGEIKMDGNPNKICSLYFNEK
jgi:lipopolysaccharide transport system ATP-binding protein